MVITGILNITLTSVRLQPPASAAEEHFAIVRCGKQEFATSKVRDNHFRNKTFTFNLKDEIEIANVIIDVFVVKQNVNALIGSTRVPLCKIVERKLGASTYNLLKLDQAKSGAIDVEFEFISIVKKDFEATYANPSTGVSASDTHPQPPKGYPQSSKNPQQTGSLEYAKGFDKNLDKNETKERGLHGLGRHSYGWAPTHQFGHSSGYGGDYYGESFSHEHYGHGHGYDYGRHGHGHGHDYGHDYGHHGYHMGPPLYDSHLEHGFHQHHHHC